MLQNQTFEQKTANTTLQNSPDPIHWEEKYSFRSHPYRHLNHQNGRIGNFTVRLVEAKDLKRSHWSVLGMGVVKHLGLSNAHGEVSSFATMKLGFRFRSDDNDDGDNDGMIGMAGPHSMMGGVGLATASMSMSASYNNIDPNLDVHKNVWQNGNIATASAALSSNNNNTNIQTNNNHHNHQNHQNRTIYNTKKSYQSSTIQFDSNPKWPSVQTETNISLFDIPLMKGALPQDGMEIILSVQMREEKTAADSFVPIGKGGGDGLLGEGEINLTGLVLRGLESNGSSGNGRRSSINHSSNNSTFVDVYDGWITLKNPYNENKKDKRTTNNNNNNSDNKSSNNKEDDNSTNDDYYGQVRLLISYEPNGMKPQRGDIIAFESFARQPYALSKCPTIIPPLHPLQIKDIRGEYILATYDMISSIQRLQSSQYQNDRIYTSSMDVVRDDDPYHNHKRTKTKQGSMRIHRNAIFVIERTNILDAAVDLSLKPTDMILSTQMGQNISDATQPYVEAAGDLLAPVLLSSRLLFEAGKVGGGALAIGVKSAIVNVVENSDPEKRRKAKRASFHSD